MTSVLVVDDGPQIVRTLSIHLRARGYHVLTASTGAAAVVSVIDHQPDAVILDLGLPDLDGVDVVRTVRASSTAPILVLSGRIDSRDKILALDCGADDYVTKPFGMEELLARLRALSRRTGPPFASSEVRLGDNVVDLAARTVHTVDGKPSPVQLTPTEWHLLEVLLRNPGRLLSRQRLLHEVWGPGYEQGNLRVYMAQLRRKLEPDHHRPRFLLNEPGMGYRFEPGETSYREA